MSNKNLLLPRIFIIIFTLIIALFLSYGSYSFFNKYQDNTYLKEVTYNANTTTDYKVYLKENNFFDEPYLGMDKTYISSLIDYISIDLNTVTNFSDKVQGTYTYSVKATLMADYSNDNKRLLTKEYILEDDKTVNFNNDNFEFNNTLKIDYQTYNDFLTEFKKENGISVDGTLLIELNLISSSTADTINNKQLHFEGTIAQVKIPLTQQVVDVAIVTNANGLNGSITDQAKYKDNVDYLLLIALILAIAALGTVVILVHLVYVLFVKKEQYRKDLDKILNSYDSIIVNVNTLPNLENYNVIRVSDFNELIDAHNELRIPINFYEEKKGYKSKFILINNNVAYVYVLYNERLRKKKHKKTL